MNADVEGLLLDASGPVASVTFNRPEKANYIDNAWIPALKAFFDRTGADPAVRAILIKANGKHFMAGGDIAFMDEMIAMGRDARVGRNLEIIIEWDEVLKAVLAMPKPVVARIQGGVVGAPVGLICVCDMVVAGEKAFLSVAHVNHAEAVSGLITYFLPRQIGYKKTMQLAMLGDRLSAREAERMGLVSLVVPDEELAAETERLMARLAKGPTAAYGLIKQQVLASLENGREAQAALEFVAASKSAATADWVEGCEALAQRRDANYVGG